MMEIFKFIFYVLFIGFLIFLHRFNMKEVKKLNLKMEQNPELKEKLEIEKSKMASYRSGSSKSLDLTDSNPKLAALIAILVFLIFFIISLNMFEETIDSFYIFLIIFLVIVLGICIKSAGKYNIKSSVYNVLTKKYGEVEICESPKPQIIKGKKSEVGNIRNKYIFSHRVSKFNCLFSNYVEEELERGRRRYGRSSYVYRKKRNFVVYNYDLKKLGLTNINDSIFSYPGVKQAIEDLNKIKIFNISVQNDNLIIAKETNLSYYVAKDFERDINDIEFFYNKIVKEIIRGAK